MFAVHRHLTKSAIYGNSARKFSAKAQSAAATTQAHPASVAELGNGLRVSAIETDSEVSTVALHVEAGTRNENAKNNGVSNFISRLVGKGTPNLTHQALKNELAKSGARLKVDVGREITTFAIEGFSKDAGRHATILSELVKNATYEEAAIKKVQDKVVKELEDLQDNYELITMDYLYSVAYQGTPLAHSLHGKTENILNMSRKDILEFLDNNYKAPRMLLSAIGKVSQGALTEVAQKHLSDVSYHYPGTATYSPPCRFTAMEVQHRDDAMPLAHMAVAFNTCGLNSHDRVGLMIAATVLGTHDHSNGPRIASTVGNIIPQTSNGLYAFKTFNHFYRDCGITGTYTVSSVQSLDDTCALVANLLMNLCHNLRYSEFEIAKKSLRIQMLNGLDDQKSQLNTLAKQVFFQGADRPSLEEVLEAIDGATPEYVMDVCNKYFHGKDFARSAYGPTEAVLDYTRMQSSLYWLRW